MTDPGCSLCQAFALNSSRWLSWKRWGEALPVIGSRIGGLPEIIEEDRTGSLFEPGNPEDLVRQVRRLWEDPQLCRRMGIAGRQKVMREYTEDAYFHNLMAVYQAAIQRCRKWRRPHSSLIPGSTAVLAPPPRRANHAQQDEHSRDQHGLSLLWRHASDIQEVALRQGVALPLPCVDQRQLLRFRSLRFELIDLYNSADIVGIDSMPFLKWARAFYNKNCDRFYAPDLMLEVSSKAKECGYTFFLYGGADDAPDKIEEYLSKRFDGIKVVGKYSPPFRPLTEEEDQAVCDMINKARPDFLWVGLGSPKQDVWISEHRDKIRGTIMVASGATFDFFSGRIKQAPLWIREAGFEWLYRLDERLPPAVGQIPRLQFHIRRDVWPSVDRTSVLHSPSTETTQFD